MPGQVLGLVVVLEVGTGRFCGGRGSWLLKAVTVLT
jgi:hypothetical protein